MIIMKYKMAILIFVMFWGLKSYAQIKSIPSDIETKHLIQKVIDAGCHIEKCDSNDETCLVINAQDKNAYETLKQPNIHIVRMFKPILKDSITSYEFYKNFNRYFSIDTSNYLMYFFRWEKDKYAIFGEAGSKVSNLNSLCFTSILSTSSEDDAFLNSPESANLILIFPTSFEATMFVSDNQIKVVIKNELVDAGVFFGRYGLLALNKLFKGIQKNAPVN